MGSTYALRLHFLLHLHIFFKIQHDYITWIFKCNPGELAHHTEMEYHIEGYIELCVSDCHPFGVLGVSSMRAGGAQADKTYAQQLCFTSLFIFGLYVGFLQRILGLKVFGKTTNSYKIWYWQYRWRSWLHRSKNEVKSSNMLFLLKSSCTCLISLCLPTGWYWAERLAWPSWPHWLWITRS